MSTEENFKVLVIVGRDKTEKRFVDRIGPYLYDSFNIRGIYALGAPEPLDDSEHFICFVAGVETDLWKMEDQMVRLNRKAEDGNPMTMHEFDDMDDALQFASVEYGFEEMSAQIQAFRERSHEIFEKFGYATALETERFMVLTALAANGMLALTRGLLDDVRVPVIILVAKGSDTMTVTPLAILMTDDILESLEMPATEKVDDDE